MRAAALVLVAVLGAVLGAAVLPPRATGADAAVALPAQKAQLVERLLGDSPAARRIAASGNDEAKRHFAGAAEHMQRARRLLDAGDAAAADAALNEALWMIGKARQLVPDSMYRIVESRVRYAQLRASLDALQGSYRRHLARQRRDPADDASLSTVVRMVEHAQSIATAEQVAEANRILVHAEAILLNAFGGVVATTLDYTPRYESPQEEYQHEADRNRSFLDLVPIAVAELNPSPEARTLIDRYVVKSRSLRDAAQKFAAGRDYASALRTLRDATGALERALTAAGLNVPKE